MSVNIEQLFNHEPVELPDKEDFLKYLYDNKNDSIYHIDRFPMLIENAKKFDQINVFYQEVLENEIEKRGFLDIELKYRNFMNKLWLYNDVFVNFSKPSGFYAPLPKIVDKEYQEYLSIFENKNYESNMFEISNKREMEFWVQIAIRDVADVTFYLKNYQAIIMPSYDLVFDIYLNNNEYHQIIKNIVASEGLFLRK